MSEDAGRRYPPTLKRLGQHFLADRRVLDRIADALELTGAETVVEIGPGRGALTDRLVGRARRLVLVEVDRALAALLRERYAGAPHVTVVERDVLESDLAGLADAPPLAAEGGGTGVADYVLVGNVPYYITTPILFRALAPPRPRRAVYLVQREVADRVAASPGGKTYGALSVNVQAVAHAAVLFGVRPGAFRPPPTVESAVVRVTPRDDPVVAPSEEAGFRALVQGAFGLRRKQMVRVVRTLASVGPDEAAAALARAGVAPDARPETLSPADFARVYRALRAGAGATRGS